jgi:hypothetical protein
MLRCQPIALKSRLCMLAIVAVIFRVRAKENAAVCLVA